MLSLSGFGVGYGPQEVVTGLTAGIEPGEFVLCTGASGAGKSSLARAIAGGLPPGAWTKGTVHCAGRFAGMWQEPSSTLSPLRRVGKQIGDVLEALGQDRTGAGQYLAPAGLAAREDAFPCALSTGQLQRVALARAMARQPALLVADEPTASLDPATEREIASMVQAWRERTGVAVLWISHRPGPVARLATQHWHLQGGRVVFGQEMPVRRETPPAPRDRPQAEPVVRASAIGKSYERPAVEDVSITLRAGESTVLRGVSGSGKSTLARILAGIEAPDSGSVWRDGEVQMVWPDATAALNPRWTALAAIGEPLWIRGTGRAERDRRAAAWMARLGLPSRYGPRRVGELSGGERRRVLIARAMVREPRCVIFDEATSGLDPDLRDEVVALLVEIQRQSRAAYLWITHDEESMRAVAGERLSMRSGRVHADD